MKKLIAIFFAFFLAGCVSMPKMQPLPVFDIKKGSKIGVVNFLDTRMTQSHVGTTIFNNFEKKHPVNWDLPGYVNREIARQASGMGYKTVIIPSNDALKAQLSEVSITEGDRFVLNPRAIPAIKNLAKKHGVDMLYVIKPFKSGILVGNVSMTVEGYGVGTQNFLMIGDAVPFANIKASSVCLKPLALTRGAICRKSKKKLNMVGNFRKITEKEKVEYGKVITGFAREFVSELLTHSNMRR